MAVVERLVVAGGLLVVAIVVALVLQRRRPAAPTQPRWEIPAQLDRADFDGAGACPWLVVVFTSTTCASCAEVVPKARALASDDVAVVEVPYQQCKDLHDRYHVGVVPLTLVAGPDGVAKASFVGTPTATDLWAAVAEAREPGSTPEPHLGS